MKDYKTVRFDDKTKDLINSRLAFEDTEKSKKLNSRNQNQAIKKYITDTIENYVNRCQSSQLLHTDVSFFRDLLTEKINQIMNKKIELLELIIKDYFFVQERYEND